MTSKGQFPCFWGLLYLLMNSVHFPHVSMGVSPDSSLSILQSSLSLWVSVLHPAEAGKDVWTAFVSGEEGGTAWQ